MDDLKDRIEELEKRIRVMALAIFWCKTHGQECPPDMPAGLAGVAYCEGKADCAACWREWGLK